MSEATSRNRLEDDLIELRHPVAILDEHLLDVPADPKTGKKPDPINLTAEYLQVIADNNNRRIKQTGDACPVVVGHTIDGAPEKHQPELVGFADNFEVKPFFKTGKKALFCRWKVFKKKFDKLKEFPRRSVELWLGKWEVDPISILGATTPDRDLGLIRLARSGETSVSRVFEDTQPMDPNKIVEDVLAQLKQDPVYQFAQELMSQAEAMDSEPAPEPSSPEPPPMPDGPPVEGDVAEQPSADSGVQDGGEAEEEAAEEPIQKSAACASGSNTFVPSGSKKMSRIESELSQLREANQHLVMKFARAERKNDLTDLAAQGYDVDIDEELSFVAPEDSLPMPDAMYQAHLARIKKKYQRAPVNTSQIVTASGPRSTSKAKVDAAVELATSKGISFEDALKQVSE